MSQHQSSIFLYDNLGELIWRSLGLAEFIGSKKEILCPHLFWLFLIKTCCNFFQCSDLWTGEGWSGKIQIQIFEATIFPEDRPFFLYSAGNAWEGPCWSAASLSGHCCRQWPGGQMQGTWLVLYYNALSYEISPIGLPKNCANVVIWTL